jgi:hypothetical protein
LIPNEGFFQVDLQKRGGGGQEGLVVGELGQVQNLFGNLVAASQLELRGALILFSSELQPRQTFFNFLLTVLTTAGAGKQKGE